MRGERPKGKSELRDRNEKLPPISKILCLLRIRTVFEKGTRVCVCVCVRVWVILYTHFRWLVHGYPGSCLMLF